MKELPKNFFIILFFFGAVFGLYAGGLKSITIRHFGDQDQIMDTIVINTHKDGFIRNIVWPYYYIGVGESLFDEIMDLIEENRNLFDEDRRGHEYGCYLLYIEIEKEEKELYLYWDEFFNKRNSDEGEKYYLYLNERNSSIIFFKKLYELIEPLKNWNQFKSILLKLIINIDWES